jgi:hypothetical protein
MLCIGASSFMKRRARSRVSRSIGCHGNFGGADPTANRRRVPAPQPSIPVPSAAPQPYGQYHATPLPPGTAFARPRPRACTQSSPDRARSSAAPHRPRGRAHNAGGGRRRTRQRPRRRCKCRQGLTGPGLRRHHVGAREPGRSQLLSPLLYHPDVAAPAHSCGLVSLPPDTAAQQQSQPVVGEVAEQLEPNRPAAECIFSTDRRRRPEARPLRITTSNGDDRQPRSPGRSGGGRLRITGPVKRPKTPLNVADVQAPGQDRHILRATLSERSGSRAVADTARENQLREWLTEDGVTYAIADLSATLSLLEVTGRLVPTAVACLETRSRPKGPGRQMGGAPFRPRRFRPRPLCRTVAVRRRRCRGSGRCGPEIRVSRMRGRATGQIPIWRC